MHHSLSPNSLITGVVSGTDGQGHLGTSKSLPCLTSLSHLTVTSRGICILKYPFFSLAEGGGGLLLCSAAGGISAGNLTYSRQEHKVNGSLLKLSLKPAEPCVRRTRVRFSSQKQDQ